MSIMIMAGLSIAGYCYRHFVDAGLIQHQVRTWLCAYPVVLFMAPFGAYILQRLDKEWMLKLICVLNIGQLLYFVLYRPSLEKMLWSAIFTAALALAFYVVVRRLVNGRRLRELDAVAEGR